MKRKILLIIFPLILTSFFSLLSSYAYAQGPVNWSGRCVVKVTPSPSGPEIEVATLQGFECIFRNIVRILVPLAGLALFLMLIAGSFQYLTAGGEPKAIEKARKTITNAIFGLVIFFGIWFILKLIQTITGVDVTIFQIPGGQ